MNESKIRHPGLVERMRISGAFGPYLDGLIPREGLQIQATAHYPTKGWTFLAMRKRENTDRGWSKNMPVVIVAVRGEDYKPGQILTRFSLGTQRASTIFRRWKKAA